MPGIYYVDTISRKTAASRKTRMAIGVCRLNLGTDPCLSEWMCEFQNKSLAKSSKRWNAISTWLAHNSPLSHIQCSIASSTLNTECHGVVRAPGYSSESRDKSCHGPPVAAAAHLIQVEGGSAAAAAASQAAPAARLQVEAHIPCRSRRCLRALSCGARLRPSLRCRCP